MIGSVFLATFLLFFVQVLYFTKGNRRLKKRHSEKISELKRFIQLNKQQLHIRDSKLNTYHFLRYNLEEVLVPENSISLA